MNFTRATKVSNEIRRINPHLFGVGGLLAQVAQQNKGQALVRDAQAQEGRSRRVDRSRGPIARVLLVSHCRPGKVLDSDNLAGGLKPLRDSIAAWLGVDDADSVIAWEYGQVETMGRLGVSVRMEAI